MASSAEEQLLLAAKSGDVDQIKSLLESGAKQIQNEEGQTPLFLASSNYYTEPKFAEAVRELLEADASTVDVKTKEGDAPVHIASSNGNLEIMELLLNYGANLDEIGQNGMVPLGVAAMKKHHALVTMIIQKLQEEEKFTENQVKWMFTAKDDNQQVHMFRAITGILKIKGVMGPLLKFNLIDAISKGLTEHKKASLQTLGLQLFKQVVASKEGKEAAKQKNIAKLIEDLTQKDGQDAVLKHLGQEILAELK